MVATALTVYGIETQNVRIAIRGCNSCVATALTVYGIETESFVFCDSKVLVATALTVYGIETQPEFY